MALITVPQLFTVGEDVLSIILFDYVGPLDTFKLQCVSHQFRAAIRRFWTYSHAWRFPWAGINVIGGILQKIRFADVEFEMCSSIFEGPKGDHIRHFLRILRHAFGKRPVAVAFEMPFKYNKERVSTYLGQGITPAQCAHHTERVPTVDLAGPYFIGFFGFQKIPDVCIMTLSFGAGPATPLAMAATPSKLLVQTPTDDLINALELSEEGKTVWSPTTTTTTTSTTAANTTTDTSSITLAKKRRTFDDITEVMVDTLKRNRHTIKGNDLAFWVLTIDRRKDYSMQIYNQFRFYTVIKTCGKHERKEMQRYNFSFN